MVRWIPLPVCRHLLVLLHQNGTVGLSGNPLHLIGHMHWNNAIITTSHRQVLSSGVLSLPLNVLCRFQTFCMAPPSSRLYLSYVFYSMPNNRHWHFDTRTRPKGLYLDHLSASWTCQLPIIQIFYALRPPDSDCFRNRAYSTSDAHDNALPESMKLHVNVSANGDVDLGELNLADMDPEVIKVSNARSSYCMGIFSVNFNCTRINLTVCVTVVHLLCSRVREAF